jgi:hypothetical protein
MLKLFRRRFFQSIGWRLILGIGGAAVVILSLFFTYYTAQELSHSERHNMEIWAEAMRGITTAEDPTLHLQIMESNTTIPVLLADDAGRVLEAFNYGDRQLDKDTAFFRKELESLKNSGTEPFVIEDGNMYKNYLYFRPSVLIKRLEWFPYMQFGLLAVFLLLAYLTWSASRRAEQERVWVGMAKETAHQLGTPITSLLGWVENLRIMYPDDETLQMIALEIGKDVELLETVAERFSKIGAIPELKPHNIYLILNVLHQYIIQRAPRKVQFHFPAPDTQPALMVDINPTLFRWVVENLLKNALDAMEGKGEISATVTQPSNWIQIDIQDTGKGMPRSLFRKVFKPGFTTKKRGWGLGLSLCKRIMEQYHNGKIFVADSAIGKGTNFRILLPCSKAISTISS